MRRLSTLPALLPALLFSVSTLGAQSTAPIRGDVNNDGRVTAVDALAILSHSVGKALPADYTMIPNGDNNGDGEVTAVDALVALSFVVGRDVTRFPINTPLQALARIEISPSSAIVLVGQTTRLAVTLRDSLGAVMAGRPVTWASSDPGVATIDASGLLTATGVGVARITATADGRAAVVAIAGDRLVEGSVTGGMTHSCGLTTAGAALCWGQNTNGQLGDGTTTGRRTPVPVSGGLVFASLTSRGAFTCGLTTAGTAYCWGLNGGGQLGNGTRTDRLVPTAVAGGGTYQSLSAGWYHVVGVTTTGALRAWGVNSNGIVGDGTTTDRLSPVAVATPPGLAFQQVSAGEYHTLALTTAGAAWAWGWNPGGRLGDGTTGTTRATPVAVQGGLVFRSVAAGGAFSTALDAAGRLYSWGAVPYELAGSTVSDRLVPELVAGDMTFRAIRSGMGLTLLLNSAGQLYWLGHAPTASWSPSFAGVPTPVPGGRAFRAMDAGANHGLGQGEDGSIYTWGDNTHGQLGDGTLVERPEPGLVSATAPAGRVTVTPAAFALVQKGSSSTIAITLARIGGFTGDVALSLEAPPGISGTFAPAVLTGAATTSTLTVTASSSAGSGMQRLRILALPAGRLSQATTSSLVVSGSALGEGMIAAGGASCALTVAGKAYCWGSPLDLGPSPLLLPTAVAPAMTFRWISVGAEHACAVTVAGSGYCWGKNDWGQLGDGTSEPARSAPTLVAGGLTFREIHAGGAMACGLTTAGAAWCWGYGAGGNARAPVAVPGGQVFHSVSVGSMHALGLTPSGELYGWGNNQQYQLGTGAVSADLTTPVRIGGTLRFIGASASGTYSAAITPEGTPYTWGTGPLGSGATVTTTKTVPAIVPKAGPYRVISAGSNGVAALGPQGQLAWWGEYLIKEGSLDGCMTGGSCGTYMTAITPRTFSSSFRTVAAGGGHTMLLDDAGVAHGFGHNGSGALGNGTTSFADHPTARPIDYSVAVSSPLWLEPGQTVNTPVTITRTGGFTTAGVGFPGDISLAIAGTLPAGVSATLAPSVAKVGTTSSTLTITTAAGAAPGPVGISVSASAAGTAARAAPLSVIVPKPVPSTGLSLECPFPPTDYKGYYCMDNGALAPGKWTIEPLHTTIGGNTWWVETGSEVCVQWDATNGRSQARYSGGLTGKPTVVDGTWGIMVKRDGTPEPRPGPSWLLFTSALDPQLKALSYKSVYGQTGVNAVPSGTSPVLNYNFQKGTCPW
ncbi:MAG: regulator of chromosome condensation [Gemmatimonadetes bacterium]|nr:regulator of chromosome condensation [Gemmatimonadota bacterium]